VNARVKAHEDILCIAETGMTEAQLVFLLDQMVEQVERRVRWQIAADFEQFGKRQSALTWGEAAVIAREGLCRCRGGSEPCDAEDIRSLVEGGES
jgi:hypothetical protein